MALILLSPAKSFDEARGLGKATTTPRFLAETGDLAEHCRALGAEGLRSLMKISPALADLNARRFAEFTTRPDPAIAHAAGLLFDGDAYQTLDLASCPAEATARAARHLRILSGLYGLLRPTDAILPYRLEMGKPLETSRGRGLYRFWGTRIAEAIATDAAEIEARFILNLASEEYAKAACLPRQSLEVVTPRFLELRGGAPKVISFSAKRARGAMTRWVLEEGIESCETLRDFSWSGYRFAPEISTPRAPSFLRSS